jgi:hypothetical protein
MSHRYADPSPCLLPLLAVKALRAVAARDHSTARTLWVRQGRTQPQPAAPLPAHGRRQPPPGGLLA